MNTAATFTTTPSATSAPDGRQRSTLSSGATATTKTSITTLLPEPGSLEARIQMFGGRPVRPPLVQKRKDQLSKKWEKDATKKTIATHGVCGRTGNNAFPEPPSKQAPSKVEWYTSPRSGVYKERIRKTEIVEESVPSPTATPSIST